MSMTQYLIQRDQNVYIVAGAAAVAFGAWLISRHHPRLRYVLGVLAIDVGWLMLIGGLFERWKW